MSQCKKRGINCHYRYARSPPCTPIQVYICPDSVILRCWRCGLIIFLKYSKKKWSKAIPTFAIEGDLCMLFISLFVIVSPSSSMLYCYTYSVALNFKFATIFNLTCSVLSSFQSRSRRCPLDTVEPGVKGKFCLQRLNSTHGPSNTITIAF